MDLSNITLFSDIDGTFINSETSDTSPSIEHAKELLKRGLTLIFVTSKTRAEMTYLLEKWDLSVTAVIENGAGRLDDSKVDWPAPPEWLDSHVYWLDEQSVTIQKRALGLHGEDLKRALTRTSSRLFLPRPNFNLDNLNRRLLAHDLQITQGGRVFCLATAKTNKGRAIQSFNASNSIGLGDAPNDISLFEAVTHRGLIFNPYCPQLELKSHISFDYESTAPAPLGWVEATNALLELR